jgi:hypothetical protein
MRISLQRKVRLSVERNLNVGLPACQTGSEEKSYFTMSILRVSTKLPAVSR